MSTRRIKSTINNRYTQPLKLKAGRKLLITPNCDYNSILFTKKHKAKTDSDYVPFVTAKFNADTFDGIHILGYLQDNDVEVSSVDCNFTVNLVSVDNNWAETLIISNAGIQNGNKFLLSVPQSIFGSIDLDGGTVLSIIMTVKRLGVTYRKKIFVNHLGAYDSILRLKAEIEFLDLTKLDE